MVRTTIRSPPVRPPARSARISRRPTWSPMAASRTCSTAGAEINGGLAQVPFDGHFAAALLAFNGTASVTQTISTVAGQNYVLSFWADTGLRRAPPPAGGRLERRPEWPCLSLSGNYQEFFLTLTGNGNLEALSLVAPAALGFQTSVQLDDISLQAFLGATPADPECAAARSRSPIRTSTTRTARRSVPEGKRLSPGRSRSIPRSRRAAAARSGGNSRSTGRRSNTWRRARCSSSSTT